MVCHIVGKEEDDPGLVHVYQEMQWDIIEVHQVDDAEEGACAKTGRIIWDVSSSTSSMSNGPIQDALEEVANIMLDVL